MGLVTFSVFHVFYSLETANAKRTLFSSELFENSILDQDGRLVGADDLPGHVIWPLAAAAGHGRV